METAPIPPALENRHGRAVARLLEKYAKPIEIENSMHVSSGGHSIHMTVGRIETTAAIITQSSPLSFGGEGLWQDVNAVAWIADTVEIYDADTASETTFEVTESDIEDVLVYDDDFEESDEKDLETYLGEIATMNGSTIRYAPKQSDRPRGGAGLLPDSGFEQRVDGLTREPSGLVRIEL